jgi:hypothetical protein
MAENQVSPFNPRKTVQSDDASLQRDGYINNYQPRQIFQ